MQMGHSVNEDIVLRRLAFGDCDCAEEGVVDRARFLPFRFGEEGEGGMVFSCS